MSNNVATVCSMRNMDKNKIRQQLEHLQREHAKTKRKLERSEKAARVKAHVKQKLREQAEANDSFDNLRNVENDPSGNHPVRKSKRCRKPSVSFKLDGLVTSEVKHVNNSYGRVQEKLFDKPCEIRTKLCNDKTPVTTTFRQGMKVDCNAAASTPSPCYVGQNGETLRRFDMHSKDKVVTVKGFNRAPTENDSNINLGRFENVSRTSLSSNRGVDDQQVGSHIPSELCSSAANVSKNTDGIPKGVSDIVCNSSSFSNANKKDATMDEPKTIECSVSKYSNADCLVNDLHQRAGCASSASLFSDSEHAVNQEDQTDIYWDKSERQDGTSESHMENYCDISSTALAQGAMETSADWTNMDIGDDTLEHLQISDEQMVTVPNLSHCKTIQVTKTSTEPVLDIHCTSITKEGQLCEAVVCSTRSVIKVWIYSQGDDGDVWAESGSHEWRSLQNDSIRQTSIISEPGSQSVTLLVCGDFKQSFVSLVVFRDNVQQVPLHGYTIESDCLACVLNPWTVVVASISTAITYLHRITLDEDYTCMDDTCDMQSAPEALLGLSNVTGLPYAILGLSQENIHVWNWETGHLLTSIPMCVTNILSVPSCNGATYEAGLLFIQVNTLTSVCLVTANPSTEKSVMLAKYGANNTHSITSSCRHNNCIMTLTQEGSIMIWDVVSGVLLGKNQSCVFSTATWHPTRPVLMLGTKSGLVHVYVKAST